MSMDAIARAPFVRVVVRPMTKVLNPVVAKLAARRHPPRYGTPGGGQAGRMSRPPGRG
jgi:hypothetical protein